MSTSGTTNFSPALADLTLEAFSRCQIRPVSLTSEHMLQARISANLELSRWSTRPSQPNLWEIDLQSVALTEGVSTYPVLVSTVTILDAYIAIPAGNQTTDRLILPISRNEYAAIPSKDQAAPPTCYWFQRTLSPQLTLWPVPDGNSAYTLHYYRMRQIEDASLAGGTGLEIPYRFLDAFAAGLAARLARKFVPTLAAELRAEAEIAWNEASHEDIETGVPISVIPALGGYYR